LEILLDINEQIKIRASKDHRIEYSGSEDYPIKMHEFRKELYNCRLMVYKTYEEMSTRVLKEDDNQAWNSVFTLCLKFIKAHVK
jgi:hypothetical protein